MGITPKIITRMKIDYTEEIRELIQNNYVPVALKFEASEYTEKKTLKEVWEMICQILPKNWVVESDVYEALADLGFKSFLVTEETVTLDEYEEPLMKETTDLFYFMDKKTAAI